MNEKKQKEEAIIERIIPDKKGEVVLAYSAKKCSGTVIKNETDALKRTAKEFHVCSILYMSMGCFFMVLGIVAASFILIIGITALPYLLLTLGGWVFFSVGRRDKATSSKITEAIKNYQPNKKYLVVYHTASTLIHELLHIKHGHFDKKGNNLAQDKEIEKETKEILKNVSTKHSNG